MNELNKKLSCLCQDDNLFQIFNRQDMVKKQAYMYQEILTSAFAFSLWNINFYVIFKHAKMCKVKHNVYGLRVWLCSLQFS